MRKRTTEIALEGLDVHVRGVLADRLGQDRVDQADDRRVVLGVHEVAGVRYLLREAAEVDVGADVGGHLHGLAVVALVGAAQAQLELLSSTRAGDEGPPRCRRSSSSTSGRRPSCRPRLRRLVRVQHHAVMRSRR
jgi:hypothetical protein